MFFFFFPQLAEALNSDQAFMDLLRQDARERKSRDADRHPMVRDDFLLDSHPDADTLHDYVLGSLDNERTREVMEHLSRCEECARRSLEIRRLDKEVTKNLQDWLKNPATP